MSMGRNRNQCLINQDSTATQRPFGSKYWKNFGNNLLISKSFPIKDSYSFALNHYHPTSDIGRHTQSSPAQNRDSTRTAPKSILSTKSWDSIYAETSFSSIPIIFMSRYSPATTLNR